MGVVVVVVFGVCLSAALRSFMQFCLMCQALCADHRFQRSRAAIEEE